MATGAPSLHARRAPDGLRNLELPEAVTGDVLSCRAERAHALEDDSSGHVRAAAANAERPERPSPIQRDGAVEQIRFWATGSAGTSSGLLAEDQRGPSRLIDHGLLQIVPRVVQIPAA